MRHTAALDPAGDPFCERSPMAWRTRLQLLGPRFRFESNSRQLLRLVKVAYAGLPPHRFSPNAAPFRIRLRLVASNALRTTPEPPSLKTLSGPGGLLCGIMDAANFAVLSPNERSGLVVVSRDMLRHPYHVRYELIEFVVFTLASRAQGLVSLHAACVGRSGRGLLLMGSSGTGKSTLALQCLMQGLDSRMSCSACALSTAPSAAPGRMVMAGVRAHRYRSVPRSALAGFRAARVAPLRSLR